MAEDNNYRSEEEQIVNEPETNEEEVEVVDFLGDVADEPMGGPVRPEELKKDPKVFKFIGKPNIADKLDGDEKDKIAYKVIEGWKLDKNSRAGRENRMREAMDMAMQVVEEKNYPWPKASNVKFPLLTVASIQFAARAYPSLIQDGKVAKGKIIGKDEYMQPVIDPNTGEPAVDPQTGQPLPPEKVSLGKQARADRIAEAMNFQLMEEMEHWEEDTDRLTNILPIVGCVFRKTYYDALNSKPDSVIVYPQDLYVKYNTVSLDRCARITHAVELTKNEIIERQRNGIFSDCEIGEGDGGLSKIHPDQSEGMYEQDEASSEFLLLEQHCWLDLDDDGYEEPYIVTVLESSSEVLRIVARYDRGDVFYDEKGRVKKIDARQYFTKYSFIPSPDGGFYDLGFGEILYPINESVNSTLNQLLDAGHLSNVGGGFIGGDLRMKAGAMRFKPGEYKIVNNFGGSLRDNIYEFARKDPSPTLFQLLGLLIDSGKEVASIKDILTGDMPVNAPATTTIAMIEQGLSSFKAIYKRLHRALKQELKKLFKLDYMFLPEEKYKEILDDPMANVSDFASTDVDVVPVSDPAAVNDMERLAKSQVLMDFLNDPYIDPMEARRRILEAIGVSNIDVLLRTPPPPPPAEPNPLAEAQLQLTNEQIESLRQDREVKKIKTESDLIKTQSDIQVAEIKADSDATRATADGVDTIARAEEREAGRQNEIYIQQLEKAKEKYIGTETNRRTEEIPQGTRGVDSRTVRPVEEPSSDQGAPTVPPGLPGGNR